MTIAILAALGIPPALIVVLLIGWMLFRRHKTIRNPAVFKARVRITDGQFPGLKDTWKKCYGAWVTTVFTTRKGLPLLITDVLPVASLDGVRDAVPDEVKGLGDTAIVASLTMVTGAKIDVALASDARAVALQPWSGYAAQTPEVVAASTALL
jgi:hypothetical protein